MAASRDLGIEENFHVGHYLVMGAFRHYGQLEMNAEFPVPEISPC
jgi:hypothetical protein